MSYSHEESPPHIVLFPSAGMGHLTPFLRLSSMLAARGCHVTVITPMPTVSAAESEYMDDFFSTHPNIHRLELQIPSSTSTADDPFLRQWISISLSTHVLEPLITSLSPPITAFFSDCAAASLCIEPISDDLNVPNYLVFTTSARFVSILATLPSINFNSSLISFPISNIPSLFFNPDHPFTKLATLNSQRLSKAKGLLINTFDYFECETIAAIRNGDISSYLPPVFTIGPLKHYNFEKRNYPSWLDDQEHESVVYVSFGSRTAMSRDQIRELGDGLEISTFPFLWVLKTSKVDKEDEEELIDLLGESFFEKTKNKGLVVKGWANQEEILGHPAIGGFVSHCGWNSVTESTRHGVPILAWPLGGDQKVNAEVVEKAGLGIWEREWGWGGERLIKGEEIGEKIRKMMGDEKLKAKAKKVRDEARKALEVDGSSDRALSNLISMVKQNLAV